MIYAHNTHALNRKYIKYMQDIYIRLTVVVTSKNILTKKYTTTNLYIWHKHKIGISPGMALFVNFFSHATERPYLKRNHVYLKT